MDTRNLETCHVYLILTESLCRHGIEETVKAAVRGGVDLVQVREKDLDEEALAERSRRVAGWLDGTGVRLILNDHPGAVESGRAHGVHLGQDDLQPELARQIIGPDKILGLSTHNLAQLRHATESSTADYVAFGPVFPTKTKHIEKGLGPEAVRLAAERCSLPLFAIGGVGPDTIGALLAVGVRRVAACSSILEAEDVQAVVRELRLRLTAKP